MPHLTETTSHELLRRKGIAVKPADEVQHPSIGKLDRAVATVIFDRDARDDTTIRLELLQQSAQRLIPLSERDAESMVTELHAEGALHALRGFYRKQTREDGRYAAHSVGRRLSCRRCPDRVAPSDPCSRATEK